MIPRLKDEYEKKTIDDLQKKFSMKKTNIWFLSLLKLF